MPETYYKEALKLAQKEYRACVSKGKSPFLPVLDEFISSENTSSGIDLGLVQIPAEKIVGTKTKGRSNAFAANFMPILEEKTEFADKWKRLCDAHLNEGIRDPITAYEYMNRFYVQEGNKRVSVLKYFKAETIVGHVIRILPEKTDDYETTLYYEFLDFYKLSKINYIEFTKKGRFAELQKLLGKEADEEWSEDEVSEFSAVYYRFKKAYISKGGEKLQSTIGDAILSYIKVYGYDELRRTNSDDIKKNLSKIWEDISLQQDQAPIEIKTDPPEEKKPSVLSKVLPVIAPSVLKAAFIYDGTPESSGWVHEHEKGRRYVQQIFDGKIETKGYTNAMADDPLKVIKQAVDDKSDIIFTTTPRLLQASLRAAVDHPNVIIMNCSLNTSHRYIRTYYTRMYEAKFILGALAGTLSASGKLGYVCDYPIYGQIAAINAFAIGAQMTNPNAKVFIEWSSIKGAKEAALALKNRGVHYISSQDTARFLNDDRNSYGLSYVNGDTQELLANPVWRWGVYYETILSRVFSKTLKSEYESSNKALNYFLGMSADVVDIVYSETLPTASKRFCELLKESIKHDVCIPFLTPLTTQKGEKIGESEKSLSLDQIINMDYLVENVIGSIPRYEELNDMGKATVETAGIDKSKKAGASLSDKGGDDE
jgi:basic membrane lipoprotein Med (substrate-binding protein (PBP1-ABC) superfamily)